MSKSPRPYRSPRRREQAEETRRRILASARKLFVERGYGGATMEAIADEAGVSVQTVYAGPGSKRGILMELLDAMAEDADLEAMTMAVEESSGDPRRQLQEHMAFTARFYAAGADLIEIARTVSGVEADLKEMWTEGEGRRHRAASTLVREWSDAGALKPDLSAREAADLFWALSGPDVFRLLVTERKWSRKRFEEHVTSMLESALLV